MRVLAAAIVCAVVFCGCGRSPTPVAQWPAGGVDGVQPGSSGARLKPQKEFVGKVASCNPAARFVVLNFPLGRLPMLDQRLNVYRGGLKVGELKITGPQLDDAIVADVTAGQADTGDEVREQ